jgi:thiosulfate/3-mercaptopyruvate sulfurtransferase
VIDTLSPRDYAGEQAKYGGKGHIPGSFNVFFQSLLQDNGTFLPVEKLKTLFEGSQALQSKRAICYCGGGIASTMVALALHLCGHSNIAVYDGSMVEWASDKTLPLKIGAVP